MEEEVDLDKLIEEPDILIKKVKVQHTGRQFTLPLPIDFIDALDIEKGDTVIIKVPLSKKKEYSIKLEKKIK